MKKPTFYWVTCSVLFLWPATLLTAPAGPPEGLDVAVVNTPLPVTGEIDATVSGDVNVTNTPLDVTVINAPVQREAYQERLNGDAGYGSSDTHWAAGTEYVPESMRLTIEFISIMYPVSTAVTTLPYCNLHATTKETCYGSLAGTVSTTHRLPLDSRRYFDFTGDGLDWITAQSIKMYIGAGERLCVRCPLPDDNNTVSSGVVHVTGYMEEID